MEKGNGEVYTLISKFDVEPQYNAEKDFVDTDNKNYFKLTKYKYGKNALMCPYCFDFTMVNVLTNLTSVVESGPVDIEDHNTEILTTVDVGYFTNKCTKCGKIGDIDLIKIDPNIARAVSELNRKGYDTKASCDGHGDIVEAYIQFKDFTALSKEQLSKLPDSWYCYSFDYDEGLLIIRGNVDSDCEYDVAFNELQEWIEWLPNRKFNVI